MEEPLLEPGKNNYSDGEGPQVASAVPKEWYFGSTNFVWIRTAFAVIAFIEFILTGASCYAFPLLLTQILPDSVPFSIAQSSFLGGLIYISLGLSGGSVLLVKKLNLDPVTEFVLWTVVASVCTVLPWVIFYWLVTTPPSAGGHTPAVVGLALVLQGYAAGVFSNVWGMYLILLFKIECFPYVLIAMNMSLPFGSIVVLLAKYALDREEWVLMELIIMGVFFSVATIFSLIFRNQVLNLPQAGPADGPPPPSTLNMVCRLLAGRSATEANIGLLQEDTIESNDVTSFQFYFFCLSYFLFNSVGSAFMANIAPLTSHVDDSNATENDQLGIFIAAMAGQLAGRGIMPFMYMGVHKFCTPTKPEAIKDDAAWQSYVQGVLVTWRNLGMTAVGSILFIVCLLLLRIVPKFPYIYAFTFIAIGYGMMWVITSNYPTFFHACHYSVLGSLFMCGGSFTTILLVSLISGLNMDKSGIFTTLMIGAVASLGACLTVLVDRRRRELKILSKY
jgi:uncharacterized membrane protein